jgi:hypothetical protein
MEEVVKVSLPEDVIIETVLAFYNVDRGIFFSNFKSRKRELVLVRQLSMVFMKKYTKYSLSKIGGVFGKDHTTVLHTENKISGYIDTYENFRKDMEALDELVRIRLNELPSVDIDKANYTKPVVKFINGLRLEKRLDNNRWHYILTRSSLSVTMLDLAVCKHEMKIEKSVSVVIPDVIPETRKINELHLWEV